MFCFLPSHYKLMVTSNIELETSLLNKLTAENEEDQKQIKIREKRMKDNETLIRALRIKLGVSSPANKATGYGTKAETVKVAIQQMTKPRFTQDDVQAELKRANPEMQINRERIRAVLWALKDKEELIKQVRKGNNRQPAEFEKLTISANGSRESKAAK
jgi:hypothetical protein